MSERGKWAYWTYGHSARAEETDYTTHRIRIKLSRRVRGSWRNAGSLLWRFTACCAAASS